MKKSAYAFSILYSTLCILGLVLVPALLNAPLKNHFHPKSELEEQDLIHRMFGGLRGLLADWAFMKGESYLHGGLPIQNIVKEGAQCLQIEMAQRKEIEEHKTVEEHAHEHEVDEHKVEETSLFSRIFYHTKVIEHTHISYAEEKEILPWFYLQVRFNPRDIQGWTLGGYWLRRLGKYDEAMKFLEEGEKKNPDSAQIKALIGYVFFLERKYPEALKKLEESRKLWQEGEPVNVVRDDYSGSERGLAYTLLAEIYKFRCEYKKAIEIYRELCTLNPERAHLLKEKIKALQ